MAALASSGTLGGKNGTVRPPVHGWSVVLLWVMTTSPLPGHHHRGRFVVMPHGAAPASADAPLPAPLTVRPERGRVGRCWSCDRPAGLHRHGAPGVRLDRLGRGPPPRAPCPGGPRAAGPWR